MQSQWTSCIRRRQKDEKQSDDSECWRQKAERWHQEELRLQRERNRLRQEAEQLYREADEKLMKAEECERKIRELEIQRQEDPAVALHIWEIQELKRQRKEALDKAIEGSVTPMRALIWGHNQYGQLGLGYTSDQVIQDPREINANSMTSWTQIECGGRHTVALSSSGEVFTWGNNDYGQLGRHSDDESRNVPTKVERFSEDRIIKVACGNYFTAALTSAGELFGW